MEKVSNCDSKYEENPKYHNLVIFGLTKVENLLPYLLKLSYLKLMVQELPIGEG